jgi:hypothetical protein
MPQSILKRENAAAGLSLRQQNPLTPALAGERENTENQ